MPTNIYQRSAMAIAIVACFPAPGYAAGVARVDFAVGNVTAQSADGRTRPLSRGSEIEVGDTVNTQQGRAQLRFQDGAYMSLQPDTAFKVDEFRFAEKGGGSDNIVMSLLKGGMRTITGLIGRANRQNYRLRTEVATIGIRGTEYAIRYTNSIEVFCAGGSISVENEGGTLVLGSGQGGFVQNPNQEPQRNDERPFLPPTAASGGQEPEEQIAPPVNPVQESQAQAILTGKFSGNLAVAQNNLGDNPLGDQQINVELDPQGRLIAFDSVEGIVSLGIGSAVAESAGNDGIIAWGRWTSGVPTGDGSPAGSDLAVEGALHYVVGLPATNMPVTGVATYAMVGATEPTFDGNIQSAKLNSSSLAVDFRWSQVSVNFNMTLNNQETVDGSGMLYDLSGSRFSHEGTGGRFVSTSGPCSSADLKVNGFLAGNGATRAGMAYQLDIGGGAVFGTVNGAIAYQRGGSLSPSSTLDPRSQQ